MWVIVVIEPGDEPSALGPFDTKEQAAQAAGDLDIGDEWTYLAEVRSVAAWLADDGLV